MSQFPAKILLFGEYGIIKGSQGIALPYSPFFGELSSAGTADKVSQTLKLNEFYEYLEGSQLLSETMDLARFKSDLENGCYFKSNIPQGYGIGSSGALCAALYAKYANDFERKDKYTNQELKSLKDKMALMESFYHGTSSGVDCLISLVNLPCLIKSRSHVEIIENPHLDSFGSFYLFDSGAARKTTSFVHHFLERYEQDDQYKSDINTFSELTDILIYQLVSHDPHDFEKNFYELSRMQYLHFSQMIPDRVKSIWLKGLETKEYSFKLSGAGGGGYFIVYSKNKLDDCQFIKNLVRINHG